MMIRSGRRVFANSEMPWPSVLDSTIYFPASDNRMTAAISVSSSMTKIFFMDSIAECYIKNSANTQLTFEPYPRIVPFNDPLDNGEPNPRPFKTLYIIHAFEQFENTVVKINIDTTPIVGNRIDNTIVFYDPLD